MISILNQLDLPKMEISIPSSSAILSSAVGSTCLISSVVTLAVGYWRFPFPFLHSHVLFFSSSFVLLSWVFFLHASSFLIILDLNLPLLSFPPSPLLSLPPRYERKSLAIQKAEIIHDLQTLTQRVGSHRDITQSLLGPRIFCKMGGTVGCKSPIYSSSGIAVIFTFTFTFHFTSFSSSFSHFFLSLLSLLLSLTSSFLAVRDHGKHDPEKGEHAAERVKNAKKQNPFHL